MSLKVGDRIRQNTLSTGIGGVSLVGDIPGFKRFSDVLSSGDITYYVIEENDKFEVGVGVYGSDNLERFHVLSSSNSGSKIELGGSGAVFVTYPADKSVIRDLESQIIVGASGLVFENGATFKEAKIVELTDVNLEGTPSNQYLIDFNTTNKSLVIGESAGPSNSRNTLIGHGAGSGVTSGTSNTNIGTDAGHKNEQGFKNVSIGDLAGPSDENASISVSRTVNVGYQAGEKSRDDSVNIGFQAGAAAYSRGHVAIGSFSGSGVGSYSFVGGYEAAQSHGGDYLVAIGYRSAKDGGGESSIWIGKQAGQNTSSAINSIGLGELSGEGSSGNNSIYLGKKSGKDNTLNDMLFVSSNSPLSEGTLIKGDFNTKRLAVGKSDVVLSDALYVGVQSSTDNGIVVQGASLQSSDLTQWRAFDGQSIASVSNSGTILANGISASGQGVRLDSATPIITGGTLYNVAGSLYWSGTSLSDQVSYASGLAVVNESDIAYVSGIVSENTADDTYVSGIAVYSSGQVIANQVDISYVSGVAVYASGNVYDDSYISGVAVYSSGQVIANQSNISTNGSRVTYASGQAIQNEFDIAYVSGIAAHGHEVTQEELSYVSGIAVYASGNVYDDTYVSGVATYSSGVLVDGGTLIPDADKGIAIAKGSENFPVTITQDDNSSGGAYYIRLRDNDTDNITFGATDVDSFQITASGEGSSDAENILKFSAVANDDHLVFGGSTVPTKVLGSNVTVDAEGSVELQRGGSTRVRGDSAFTYLFGQTGGYIFYGANALKPQSATSIALGGTSNYWSSLYSSDANLKGSAATNVPLTIDSQPAQSANLTEFKANDGVVVAQVEPDGSIATSGDISSSGTLIAGELKSPQDTGGYLRLRGSNDTYIDVSDGTMNFYCNTGQAFRLTSSFVDVFKTIRPISNQDLGRVTNRWPNLYAASGSFTGDLSVDQGGYFKFFSLGDNHTNTTNSQWLQMSASTQAYTISSEATGSGVSRDVYVSVGGSSNLMLRSDHTRLMQYVRPQSTNTTDIGTSSIRFRKIYMVDGDFSNSLHVTAGDATTVPTTIQSAVAQSANLTEWRASDDVVIAQVEPDGSIATSGNVNVSGVVTTGTIKGTYSLAEPPKIVFDSIYGYLYGYFGARALKFGHNKVELYKDLIPVFDNSVACGEDGKRWSNVASVDGDFSKTVSASGVIASGTVTANTIDTTWVRSNGNLKLLLGVNGFIYYDNLRPNANGTQSVGLATQRFGNFYGVDGDFSNTVSSSGVQASGMLLYSHTPTDTSNKLYNNGGTLMFNGSAVDSGQVSGSASGVAFFGADGLLKDSTDLRFEETNGRLGIGLVSNNISNNLTVYDSSQNYPLRVGNNTANNHGVWTGMTFFNSTNTLGGPTQEGQASIRAYRYGTGYGGELEFLLGGTSVMRIDTEGHTGLGTITPDAKLHAVSTNATDVGIIAQGGAAQSANLTEWRASDDVVVAQVEPDGSIASSGNISASGELVANQFLKFYGGNGPDIYSTASHAYLRNSAGQSRLRWGTDGGIMVFGSITPNTGNAYDIGENGNRTYRNLYLGTSLHSSGVITSGVLLPSHVPTDTTSQLYNDGGTLMFNGSAVGGTDAYTSGVAAYASGVVNGGVATLASGIIQDGGALKIYSQGTQGSTDSQYLDFSFDDSSNYPTISQQVTGTGALAYVLALKNGDGQLQIKTNGGFNFKDGASDLFIVASNAISSYRTNRPANNGYLDLGASTLRWKDTYSVNGDFSGSVSGARGFFESATTTDSPLTITSAVSQTANLTEWKNSSDETLTKVTSDGSVHVSGNIVSEQDGEIRSYILGKPGDTDTEYLRIGDLAGIVHQIQPQSTGSGQNRHIRITSADGRGKLNLYSDGHLNYGFNNNLTFSAFHWGISVSGEIRNMQSSNPSSLGSSSSPFGNVYSQNGSFTGNLDVEVSGSNRLFKIGGDADVAAGDTEYLETVVDTDTYCIRTGATGTGTAIRNIYVGTGFGGNNTRGVIIKNSEAEFNFGGPRFKIAGGQHTTWAKILPAVDDVYALGEDGKRWYNVASVDGDFSGSVSGARGFFESATTTDSALTITSTVSQTANLQEWRASDDVVIAQVEPDGSIATSGDVSVSGNLVANQYLKFFGGNGPDIYSTGAHAYLRDASGASKFRWGTGGSVMIFAGITPNTPNLYDLGDHRTFRNLYLGTSLHSSGVQTSGVLLHSHVPTDTTSQLYNDGGTLMFNGSAVGGSVTGTPSGVAFFGDDGSLTDHTDLITSSGTNGRRIGINSVANPTYQLTVGNQVYNQSAIAEIKNYSRGNSILQIVATSGGRSANIKYSSGSTDWYQGHLQASMAGLGGRFVVASYELDNTKPLVYDSNGDFVIGGVAPSARLTVNSRGTTVVNTVFKATASQTANMAEWRASDDVVIAHVSADGSIATSGDVSVSGTLTVDLVDTVGSTLTVRNAGAAAINIGSSSRITCYYPVVPDNTGTKSLGLGNRRWSDVYAVDGDFAGNLNASGVQASGLLLHDHAPTDTDNKIYNNGGTLTWDGHFAASSKSFLIDHPTQKDAKLQYGSLEGPENGVYVRGSVTGNVIELPDYWIGLVDEESISVQLTAKNQPQPNIFVSGVLDNKVYINSDRDINAFYNVYAERKDIDKLEVEIWQ